MAKDADATRSLTDYTVSVADVGATMPADTSAALVGFTEIGLVSDDGITRGRTGDVTELFDAAGRKVRTFRAKQARTFKFVALEDNATVRELEEPGATVDTTDPTMTKYTVKDAAPARKAFVIEAVDNVNGADVVRRFLVAEGEVVPTADSTLVDASVELREFTVTTIKQSDGTHYVELVDVVA